MQCCSRPLASVSVMLPEPTGISIGHVAQAHWRQSLPITRSHWHHSVQHCLSQLASISATLLKPTDLLPAFHTQVSGHPRACAHHALAVQRQPAHRNRACTTCTPCTHGFSSFKITPLLAPLKPDRCAISLWKGVMKCASSRRGKMQMPAHHRHTFLHAIKQCLANPKGAHLGRKACREHPCMHPNCSIRG